MRLRLLAVGSALLAILFLSLWVVPFAAAQDGDDPEPTETTEPEAEATEAGSDEEGTGTSEDCLICHAGLDSHTTFLNGETRDIQMADSGLNESVHAELNCQDCHGDYEFPHETNEYESDRDFRLTWVKACESCHSKESDLAGDSVHAAAQLEGNENAAVCSDCHGYHEVREKSNAEISQTCGSCHTSEFDLFKDSVHGEAVLAGNPDTPTCISCHGVHNIADPTTNLFRVRSPQLCASCHANEELMGKYDISTHVFDSYVSDFHGTTVTLFENQSPDAEVNTAVCFDCHGVHDIRSPDDPQSRVVKENLVETCQKCHPDASADFAEAWTKHYEPSATEYPLVFFVDQFYKLFIPGVLGFMALFVLSDIGKRVTQRLRHSDDGPPVEPPKESE